MKPSALLVMKKECSCARKDTAVTRDREQMRNQPKPTAWAHAVERPPGNPYMNAPIGILPACPRAAHRTSRSDFQGAGHGKTGPQTKGVHAPNKPAQMRNALSRSAMAHPDPERFWRERPAKV